MAVSLLLDGDVYYYLNLLYYTGARNVANNENLDTFWSCLSTTELMDMSEKDINDSCIKIRETRDIGLDGYLISKKCDISFSNYRKYSSRHEDNFTTTLQNAKQILTRLNKSDFKPVISSVTKNYQFKLDNIGSFLQLQDIDELGCVLQYDNPRYNGLLQTTQRNLLIRELNSLGFKCSINERDIDVLRTLLNGCVCYSDELDQMGEGKSMQ